jgi:hypothetical protein
MPFGRHAQLPTVNANTKVEGAKPQESDQGGGATERKDTRGIEEKSHEINSARRLQSQSASPSLTHTVAGVPLYRFSRRYV